MRRKGSAIENMGRREGEPLARLRKEDLLPLPGVNGADVDGGPVGSPGATPNGPSGYSLDGVSALALPSPRGHEEEELVDAFLKGLKKLFSMNDNWTFLEELRRTLDSCVQCQTCSEACPVYIASGRQEIYRPSFRSEVLRRLVARHVKPWGRLFPGLRGNGIDLSWPLISRLAESAYRCTMCRRCAMRCPMGSDNGLVTHEIRKLFSQEMGIAPKELHQDGSMRQLRTGASTGVSSKAFMNIISFMEDEIEEKTGRRITVPVDREGADILLVHNSGEYLSWIENPAALAIIFEEAGLSWTLSSELYGYEGTNYGLWYDDVQCARIVMRQVEVALKLGVRKIVMGECGHGTKALVVIGDRILTGNWNSQRESILPLLEDIVCNGRIKVDPGRNGFPVTLHDPCNMVRLMGIIEPQRRILRKICPDFREMEPHGPDNYCCGGGSGFAVISSRNFPQWKVNVAGRMKVKQILEAFRDVPDPSIKKYVCAPCSNCKGQLRDLLTHYHLQETHAIHHGGLSDLIVNALPHLKKPYIEWPSED